MSPVGKDGLKRNVAKLLEEGKIWYVAMGPHWKRFFKSLTPKHWDDFFHAYVNLYVESNRASPYFVGHMEAVAVPLGVILGIIMI